MNDNGPIFKAGEVAEKILLLLHDEYPKLGDGKAGEMMVCLAIAVAGAFVCGFDGEDEFNIDLFKKNVEEYVAIGREKVKNYKGKAWTSK